MNNSELEKKCRTYIKSAQGSITLTLILSLIYIVRAFISGNLNFWFSTYVVEFLVKSSDFCTQYAGSLSKPLAAVLIVAFIALLACATALSQKKGEWLFVCLVIYGLDTALLLWGDFSNHFEPFTQDKWIDIVVHAFVLVFIIVGIVGFRGLRKMNLSEQEPKQ